MDLTDRVVVVTGAAGGIGRAVVERLVHAGAHVGAIDKVPCALDGALSVEADVRDPAAVATAVDRIAAEYGRIDGVVNNAAILRDGALVKLTRGGIETLDLESWNDTLQTNLTGTFLVARAAITHMIRAKSKGAIVNLSSISRRGNAGQSAYAATKAAVDALTRTWAQELAFFKIRVVAIAPGLIDTPMFRSIPEPRVAAYKQRIPAGRIGLPDDIAKMIQAVFENDYVNGTTLEVDGGFTF
ncbi:MAG: hypothetical protein BGO98_32030 [Myxococcales bacterium 68-20]|nr:SDR family oxidoreductase [Myxococcales bacterium]OJY18375.1 MAG: hypothetical protein BGO98_32030 [Myxococcales bacterium 68-20]